MDARDCAELYTTFGLDRCTGPGYIAILRDGIYYYVLAEVPPVRHC